MLSSMKGVKMAGLTGKLTSIIQGLRLTEVKSAYKFRMILAWTSVMGEMLSFLILYFYFLFFLVIQSDCPSLYTCATKPRTHICCFCGNYSSNQYITGYCENVHINISTYNPSAATLPGVPKYSHNIGFNQLFSKDTNLLAIGVEI